MRTLLALVNVYIKISIGELIILELCIEQADQINLTYKLHYEMS